MEIQLGEIPARQKYLIDRTHDRNLGEKKQWGKTQTTWVVTKEITICLVLETNDETESICDVSR